MNVYVEITVADHVKSRLDCWKIKINFFKGKPFSITLVTDDSMTGRESIYVRCSLAAYKLLRNGVIFACHSTISKDAEGPNGVCQDRHHHCNDFHQQTRGRGCAFSIPMRSGLEHVPVVHQQQSGC